MSKILYDSVVMAFCLLLYAYFGWHYFYGPRSISLHAATVANRAALTRELEQEVQKSQQLEEKVQLLRPEHIDSDLLEELARRILNYTASSELVLPR
jgi:cell division protein FtsB